MDSPTSPMPAPQSPNLNVQDLHAWIAKQADGLRIPVTDVSRLNFPEVLDRIRAAERIEVENKVRAEYESRDRQRVELLTRWQLEEQQRLATAEANRQSAEQRAADLHARLLVAERDLYSVRSEIATIKYQVEVRDAELRMMRDREAQRAQSELTGKVFGAMGDILRHGFRR